MAQKQLVNTVEEVKLVAVLTHSSHSVTFVFLSIFFFFFFSLQVCVDNVLKTMKENANKASSILLTAIPQISQMDWAQTIRTLKVGWHLHDESFPFSK